MNHETASALLSDYVLGHLSPGDAEGVRVHLAECGTCRSVAETMRRVDSQVESYGDALFGDHPSAEALAAFVSGGKGLSTSSLAAVSAHVQACPTCGHELNLIRDSREAAFRKRPWSLWWRFPFGIPAPALAAGLAVLLLILGIPAYEGLVILPQARRGLERAAVVGDSLRGLSENLRRELAESNERLSSVPAGGGAARVLYVRAKRRSASEAMPEIPSRAGQPFQPIIIEFPPLADPDYRANRTLEITIRRPPEAPAVWATTGPAAELWDPGTRTVNLLVPASLLTEGRYELAIRSLNDRAPELLTPFRVTAPLR